MKRITKQDSPYKVDQVHPDVEPLDYNPVPLREGQAFIFRKRSDGKVQVTVKEARGVYDSGSSVTFDPEYAPAVAEAVLLASRYVERESTVTVSTEREGLLQTLQTEHDQHSEMWAKRDYLAQVSGFSSYEEAPKHVRDLIDYSIAKGI